MPFFNYGKKVQKSSSSLTPTLFYDPNDTNSLSGLGDTTITNIGSLGNVSGTEGTLFGVSYVPVTWPPVSSNTFAGLDFDGGSDRIVFNSFDFGSIMTVSAWIYPRTEFSINTVMSNASAGLNSNGFKLEWNNWQTSDLRMLIEAGNGTQGNVLQSVDPVIVLDEFQQLTWVIDFANTTATFYRNGVVVPTSGGMVANINTNAIWNIGSMMGSYYMNGILGTLKVYNTLLTSSEVLDEFNSSKSRFGL